MLQIPKHISEDMIQHAREHDPHECCGILAGKDGVVTEHYRITNVLAVMSEAELERFEGAKLSDLQQLSPEERADIAFQMDAREMSLAQKDKLLIYDALDMKFRKVGRPKDPDCPLCGKNPTITTLEEHHVSCSL